MGFPCFDKGADKLCRVCKVDVLIKEAVDDQETPLFIRKIMNVREDGTPLVGTVIRFWKTHVSLRVASVVEVPGSDRSPSHGDLESVGELSEAHEGQVATIRPAVNSHSLHVDETHSFCYRSQHFHLILQFNRPLQRMKDTWNQVPIVLISAAAEKLLR